MARKQPINAKTLGAVVGAISALVAYLTVSGVILLPFGGNSIERQIETFATDTNKRLPMQFDKVTRWDRVEAGPGKAYSYIYTLSMVPTEEQKRVLVETITRKALATPDMQPIFAAGVTVWYKYYDSSGKKLIEFPVKK